MIHCLSDLITELHHIMDKHGDIGVSIRQGATLAHISEVYALSALILQTQRRFGKEALCVIMADKEG